MFEEITCANLSIVQVKLEKELSAMCEKRQEEVMHEFTN